MTKIAGSRSDLDPLVRGIDPRIRIRIHTKMSCIRNTGLQNLHLAFIVIRAESGIGAVAEGIYCRKSPESEHPRKSEE
jgi:hypothetical protein